MVITARIKRIRARFAVVQAIYNWPVTRRATNLVKAAAVTVISASITAVRVRLVKVSESCPEKKSSKPQDCGLFLYAGGDDPTRPITQRRKFGDECRRLGPIDHAKRSLWYGGGKIRKQFLDRDGSIFVSIGFAIQSAKQKIRKQTMADRRKVVTRFSVLGGSKHDDFLGLRRPFYNELACVGWRE